MEHYGAVVRNVAMLNNTLKDVWAEWGRQVYTVDPRSEATVRGYVSEGTAGGVAGTEGATQVRAVIVEDGCCAGIRVGEGGARQEGGEARR
jgi:hypothetical protein